MTVANGGKSDALHVSWRPAEGVADSYLVCLLDGKRTVHTLVVSSSSPPECSFSSLVPGRLYSVAIVTRSSVMENTTVVQARTRERVLDLFVFVSLRLFVFFNRRCRFVCFTEPATVQNPTAVHSARDDFLKVRWTKTSRGQSVF